MRISDGRAAACGDRKSARFSRRLVIFLAALGIGAVSSAYATESTANLSFRGSAFRVDQRTGELVQSVTVTNNGTAPVQGVLELLLHGIDQDIQVAGTLHQVSLLGANLASVILATGKGNSMTLKPGEHVTTILRFKTAGKKAIRYSPQIVLKGVYKH